MEGLRGRGRDDSRIFWSELKVERKKKKKAKARSKMKTIKPLSQPRGSSQLTAEPTSATLLWPCEPGSGPMAASEAGGENPR